MHVARIHRRERLAIILRSLTASAAHGSHCPVNDQRPKFSDEKMQQVILYFLERINNVHLEPTKFLAN